MKLHLHIEQLTLDAGLADQPHALEMSLRAELARVFAAHGVPAHWQQPRAVQALDAPVLRIDRAGTLSARDVAGALHAALHAPAAAKETGGVP